MKPPQRTIEQEGSRVSNNGDEHHGPTNLSINRGIEMPTRKIKKAGKHKNRSTFRNGNLLTVPHTNKRASSINVFQSDLYSITAQ